MSDGSDSECAYVCMYVYDRVVFVVCVCVGG